MKLIAQILAWLGLVILLLVLPAGYDHSHTIVTGGSIGFGGGHFLVLCAGIIAAVFGLGGITGIGYYWMFIIAAGIAQIGAFYGCFIDFSAWFFVYITPGILMIAEGVYYRIKEIRQQKQAA